MTPDNLESPCVGVTPKTVAAVLGLALRDQRRLRHAMRQSGKLPRLKKASVIKHHLFAIGANVS